MKTTKALIAWAVNDDVWQEFRKSLKGKSTQVKLDELRQYWAKDHGGMNLAISACPVCIQVDNYLKALARGGQLHPGVSLQLAVDNDWKLPIKK